MTDDEFLLQRIELRLTPPNEKGCRLWTGSKTGGYGMISVRGKVGMVNRHIFRIHYGYLPQEIRHTCDEPACGTLHHFKPGTHKQNMEDSVARGRNRAAKPGNGFDKLGSEGRTRIRALWATRIYNKSQIARMFSVTPSRVRQIVTGK